MSVPLQTLHLFSLDPNSTNLPENSSKMKTNSSNSINLSTKINELLFEQIQQTVPNHLQHAVIPNFFSFQILIQHTLQSN